MKKLNLGLKNNEESIYENQSWEMPKKESSQNFVNPLRNNFSTSNEQGNSFINNLDDFELECNIKIKVFGLGGAGNNMVAHIAETTNVDPKCLYALNTDYQFLKKLPNKFNKILIGKTVTKGMGSGSDPKVGQEAALEDANDIREKLKGTDLLFIVSGMGKGTGTGASPVVAEIAKEMGILTICVVNLPSITAEGKVIYEKGIAGLNSLKKYADGLSTISNEKIISENNLGNEISLRDSFALANDFISTIVSEIINIVNVPAEINVDFNDVKTFFNEKTQFQVNTFDFSSGENIKEIVANRIKSAIYLEEIRNSKKIIINFKLNPKVPRNFISTIRQVLEEELQNNDFSLTYAVDYSENIEFASFTMLIATNDKEENATNESFVKSPSISVVEDSINTYNQQCSEDVKIKSVKENKPLYDVVQNIQPIDVEFVNDASVNNFVSKKFEISDFDFSDENIKDIPPTNRLYNNMDGQHNLNKDVNEMKNFILENNIEVSGNAIDSNRGSQYELEQLKKQMNNEIHWDINDYVNGSKQNFNNAYVASVQNDFKELHTAVQAQQKTYDYNNNQTHTITKQIRENIGSGPITNSTSLNRFFTKNLKFARLTKENKIPGKN